MLMEERVLFTYCASYTTWDAPILSGRIIKRDLGEKIILYEVFRNTSILVSEFIGHKLKGNVVHDLMGHRRTEARTTEARTTEARTASWTALTEARTTEAVDNWTALTEHKLSIFLSIDKFFFRIEANE